MLTACSGSSTPVSTLPPDSPPPTAVAVASPQPSSGPPSPEVTPTPSIAATARATPRCATTQLVLDLGPAQGAAGSQYLPVRLRNRGASCRLGGYPGVGLLDAQGRQLGDPAGRSGGGGSVFDLSPGATAHAVLSIANAGAFPDSACRPAQASAVRVYPPDQTAFRTAAFSVLACSARGVGQLHITAMTPGAG